MSLDRTWRVLQRHLELNPDDVRALGFAAGVLALQKRTGECNDLIQRALRLCPDDWDHLVTLACAATLNGDHGRALDLLERASSTGRGDRDLLLQDNDLKPLHDLPRFQALIQALAD